MSQNLIESAGGHAQKQTKFVSLFTSRFIAGLYTNRSLLRSPMQSIYSDFYKLGATDALCDGLNAELSVRLTMIRRPGNYRWCSVETDSAVDSFYSFHHADGTIQVIADTVAYVDVATPTSLTEIFHKSTGAGEAYFQGINETLYITDGVDFVTYTPGINNPQTGNPIFNMGGVGPTKAPVLTLTETGSAGIVWVASTMWTTMGLIVDNNGNVQQLVSVNASSTNTTQLGTSGNGAPDFSGGIGTTITESSGTPITWTNVGLVGTWLPGHAYSNINGTITLAAPCAIYDPVSNSMYLVDNPGSAGGTSGSAKPAFSGVLGSTFHDGSIKWFCFGNAGIPYPILWKPGTVYAQRTGGNYANATIVTPTTIPAAGLGSANPTSVYLWESSGGTSGTSAYTPNWATGIGDPTMDGDLIWNCLGSATWAANHNYIAWSASSTSFSVIKDPNGNLQVAITVTGPSGALIPATWSTGYGQTTQDGTNVGTSSFIGVTWYCVGTSLSWAASTQWYLPVGGFVPPQPSQAYGGATLVDTNGNNQYVINSGKSGSSTPAWGALYANTTDGGVTWYAASKFTAAGFSWTKGYGYVYEYYSRGASDYYNTNPPPLQIPNTNSPNVTGPLGPPFGSQSEAITDASPLAQIIGGNAGAQVLITMQGSTDPQYDTILVFRSADGFGASGPYLFLTEINMPPMQGSQPGVAQIIDFMPDLPTNLLPGLDPLFTAQVDGENAPPPGSYGSSEFTPSVSGSTVAAAGTGMIGLVYFLGRLWGFIGNTVFASAGPDNTDGNGFTSWPAINAFPFDSNIVRLMPTSSALLVFTTTDTYIIAGGPAISDFYSQLLAPGVGLLSGNAVTMMLGLPYLFTSDRQYITIDPNGGFTRIGHPIGDKLVAYNPASVYTAYHSFGDQEHALFVANGSSEWYRCDPNPTPDSQLTGPIWSPRATISGGFKAIASIETSPGVRSLLIGPATAGYILARDSNYSVFADNGSAYSSYFTMGNIVLAHPGQMAECAFVEMDFTQVGSHPAVLVLFDELSATNGAAFESISNSFVSDPPKLYGPTLTPATLWMNRYYFGQTSPGNPNNEPLPAWCKFVQLKVDFGATDTVQNELLAFSIFGALYQEK